MEVGIGLRFRSSTSRAYYLHPISLFCRPKNLDRAHKSTLKHSNDPGETKLNQLFPYILNLRSSLFWLPAITSYEPKRVILASNSARYSGSHVSNQTHFRNKHSFALRFLRMSIRSHPKICIFVSITENIAKMHICFDAKTIYVCTVIVTSERHQFRTPYTSSVAYAAPNLTLYGPPTPTNKRCCFLKKGLSPLTNQKNRSPALYIRVPKECDLMRFTKRRDIIALVKRMSFHPKHRK